MRRVVVPFVLMLALAPSLALAEASPEWRIKLDLSWTAPGVKRVTVQEASAASTGYNVDEDTLKIDQIVEFTTKPVTVTLYTDGLGHEFAILPRQAVQSESLYLQLPEKTACDQDVRSDFQRDALSDNRERAIKGILGMQMLLSLKGQQGCSKRTNKRLREWNVDAHCNLSENSTFFSVPRFEDYPKYLRDQAIRCQQIARVNFIDSRFAALNTLIRGHEYRKLDVELPRVKAIFEDQAWQPIVSEARVGLVNLQHYEVESAYNQALALRTKARAAETGGNLSEADALYGEAIIYSTKLQEWGDSNQALDLYAEAWRRAKVSPRDGMSIHEGLLKAQKRVELSEQLLMEATEEVSSDAESM
ncbi:MAG: hypothetical protein AAFY51_09575 [Pseudomonadota bacterium]